MKAVYSLRHRLHHPQREIEASGFHEPLERPERAELILAALVADGAFELVAPDEWGTGPIEVVHDPGLVRFLETAWDDYQQLHPATHDVVPDVFNVAALRDGMGPADEPLDASMRMGWWCFETTTPVTRGTYDAARSAVDVALSSAALVLGGEPVAYGLCRPPGHHAARAVYGGYCFFNNAAIVADRVAADTGGKVTVLDVDYHHGNGTQQITYGRGDIQFVSLHGDPRGAYPYVTGHRHETGAGDGADTTCNHPLPAGTGDDHYLVALSAACDDIDAFGPEVLVVSLGVDTHWDDPLGDFELTTDGFASAGAMVRDLGVPTVVLQEGGYATDALGDNVVAWLNGIRPDAPAGPEPPTPA